MNVQWTPEQVRQTAGLLGTYAVDHKLRAMLDAYAARLEADANVGAPDDTEVAAVEDRWRRYDTGDCSEPLLLEDLFVVIAAYRAKCEAKLITERNEARAERNEYFAERNDFSEKFSAATVRIHELDSENQCLREQLNEAETRAETISAMAGTRVFHDVKTWTCTGCHDEEGG